MKFRLNNAGRRSIALLAVAGALSLTGCSASSSPNNESKTEESDVRWYSDYVELPDGREVLCIWDNGGYLSCDWESIHSEVNPEREAR